MYLGVSMSKLHAFNHWRWVPCFIEWCLLHSTLSSVSEVRIVVWRMASSWYCIDGTSPADLVLWFVSCNLVSSQHRSYWVHTSYWTFICIAHSLGGPYRSVHVLVLYSMGKVTQSQCDIALSFSLQGVRMGGWFSPSFIAVIVSLLVWWLAYMTKSKLQE